MPRRRSHFVALREKRFLNARAFGASPSLPNKEFVNSLKADGNKKGSVFYTTHSYPTKIPVELVARYLLEHTRKGEVVLDPFCGSGMTGMAAAFTGRHAYLSDIGCLSLHLAFNHVRGCDPKALLAIGKKVIEEAKAIGNPYAFSLGRLSYELKYVVVSDVFACGKCRREVSFWEAAVDHRTKDLRKDPKCPYCGAGISKAHANPVESQPSFAVYSPAKANGGKKGNIEAKLDSRFRRAIEFELPAGFRLPIHNEAIQPNREMYIRSALKLHGVQYLTDFYTPRNLAALSQLHVQIGGVKDERVKAALMFAFTNSAWHGSRLRRFNNRGGHRPLTGTLYIPQLISEGNVYDIFERKIEHLAKFYEAFESYQTGSGIHLSQSSATKLAHIPDGSVDYVFTDPPFGANIFYADCNFLAEAWLGSLTDTTQEAVMNKSLKPEAGGKTIFDYKALMRASFCELARVLKRGRKAHVVFNNTEGVVWKEVMDALSEAGFELSKSSQMNKHQKSVKGYKGALGAENVASTDLVMELVNRRRKHRATETQVFKPGELEEAVRQVFREFRLGKKGFDKKFVFSEFYSFFLTYCHQKKLDVSEVDFGFIKELVIEANPSSKEAIS